MAINKDTTIHELLTQHPYLREWLTAYAPEFKKLGNPVLFKTVARAASIEAAAQMGDVSLEALLDDILTKIAQHGIAEEEAAGVTDPDGERGTRQEELKRIILRLHDGDSVDDVKADFDALSADIDSAEIAAMEQALIAEGMPPEEVQRLCDVHVSVFKDALEVEDDLEVPQGHPIQAYLQENERASVIVSEIEEALREVSGEGSSADVAWSRIRDGIGNLSEVAVHYTRKENQLFPVLEENGVEGPTKVMWGIDDDIRQRLEDARETVASGERESLVDGLPETLRMILDMIYKEEKILFPTALEVIPHEKWEEIAAGDGEIGYAWIEPPERYGGSPSPGPAADAQAGSPVADEIPLPTGALDVGQLGLLFQQLPFDLTYVDSEDRVRFYTEGDRVFPRSPAVIGREVRNCHPPSSVDKVEEILTEFRAGAKDTAEFWIELSDRFIHIRYFALRDAAGEYSGCLEVVQDATRIRSLEGQNRLLDW